MQRQTDFLIYQSIAEQHRATYYACYLLDIDFFVRKNL